jgi:hypothetical protein
MHQAAPLMIKASPNEKHYHEWNKPEMGFTAHNRSTRNTPHDTSEPTKSNMTMAYLDQQKTNSNRITNEITN